MAQSVAAAAAAKRNSETARRSGPGLDVSFVLIVFGSYRFVQRGASKLFYLPLTHFLRVGLFELALCSAVWLAERVGGVILLGVK